MGKRNCRHCFYDTLDKNDLDFKQCDHPSEVEIPESTFEKYGDDELPDHCGCYVFSFSNWLNWKIFLLFNMGSKK